MWVAWKVTRRKDQNNEEGRLAARFDGHDVSWDSRWSPKEMTCCRWALRLAAREQRVQRVENGGTSNTPETRIEGRED